MNWSDSEWVNVIMDSAVEIAKSIVLAIIVLLVGLFIIKQITKFVEKRINKTKMDVSLKPFIVGLIGTILKTLLILSVISILGVPAASFIAVLGAAGLAVGLAFQGSLANFAGGVLLLSFRPFKVGDYIEGAGYSGTVQSIQILYTVLSTPDNKVIYIPNGNLSNSGIVNYSVNDIRRVDLTFRADYANDSEKVISILEQAVHNHSLTLKEPEPFIRLSEHGQDSVVYTVRAWVNAADYWSVYFDLLEAVKLRFDEENIKIPYQQMDVHINEVKAK